MNGELGHVSVSVRRRRCCLLLFSCCLFARPDAVCPCPPYSNLSLSVQSSPSEPSHAVGSPARVRERVHACYVFLSQDHDSTPVCTRPACDCFAKRPACHSRPAPSHRCHYRLQSARNRMAGGRSLARVMLRKVGGA
ncbi:hypothetical protein SKAU_G00003370 [Synaphobranchus kaupii]|uniref:Secreted protein n=1 Tax=Synaphobranchus kaupii TaxID=118154 RepID=A0A9Q1JCT1_SYNKA|nr:hypothetical protein SKAU_G00003370 [Synaphobranchus kaupii]